MCTDDANRFEKIRKIENDVSLGGRTTENENNLLQFLTALLANLGPGGDLTGGVGLLGKRILVLISARVGLQSATAFPL